MEQFDKPDKLIKFGHKPGFKVVEFDRLNIKNDWVWNPEKKSAEYFPMSRVEVKH